MGRRAVAAVTVGALALLGCRPGTVSLGVAPREGDTYRYRYEIELSLTRIVEGSAPEVTELVATLISDQEVLEVTEDGALVEVTLTSDGTAPRTAVVQLDRAGSLQAIEEIEGLPSDEIGLPAAGSLLASTSIEPPDRPLAPGTRWTIDDGDITGTARLDRLGVIDDHEVAVVRASLMEALRETVTAEDSEVTLDGDLRSVTSTTFDIADGAVREADTQAEGNVDLQISPPTGVTAPPVMATISYELRVRTTRLD